jgi:hypothetical protein
MKCHEAKKNDEVVSSNNLGGIWCLISVIVAT